MIRMGLISSLDVVIMADDLEPLNITTELNHQELNNLLENNIIKYNENSVLIDLENGLYMGYDIMNMSDLITQIRLEIDVMNFIHNTTKLIDEVVIKMDGVD